MLKDITLGQYYQGESIIHRLDPRVKLFAVLAYMICLFWNDNVWMFIFPAVVLVIIIGISGIPMKFIMRGMKGIVILLLFSSMFNIFYTDGRVLFQYAFLKITYEGIVRAAVISIRLMLLIIASSVLTLTTTPTNLTDGLEKSLGFLAKIHVPIHEIALMMSIALRFIPILADETDKIMKAQIARGADFEEGGVLKRAKGMLPIIVPLFVAAIRKADDLATAMDSRCYRGGSGRTKLRPLRYQRIDRIAYFLIILFIFINFLQDKVICVILL